MTAAPNRLAANFEQWVADIPRRVELEKAHRSFEDLTKALQNARAQGVAMDLSQILVLEDEKLEQVLRLHASERLCEARAAEMKMLFDQVEELKSHIERLTSSQDEAIHRSVRADKRELVEAYGRVFGAVKAKFEKRKVKTDNEANLREIYSNLELIMDITARGEETAEKDKLDSLLPETEAACKNAMLSVLELVFMLLLGLGFLNRLLSFVIELGFFHWLLSENFAFTRF